MQRRFLVVNPNTSPEVTRAYLATARALAPPEIELTGVTGRFGARIVSTEAENVIAGHSALDLVAAHAAGHEAVILAISFDSALEALRSVMPMPVIGITEAALAAAAAGGRTVGVVFFGEVSRGMYEAVLARNGVKPSGVVSVEIGGVTDYLSPEAKDRAVLDACRRLAAGGAEAIVICGAAIVGMAARLAPGAPVPLYDGSAAVHACLAGQLPVRKGAPLLPLGESIGLPPALGRLLNGELT